MRTSEAEQPNLGDVLPRHCTHTYNFDTVSENNKTYFKAFVGVRSFPPRNEV